MGCCIPVFSQNLVLEMINRRKLGEQEEVFNEKSQEMGLEKPDSLFLSDSDKIEL